MSAIVTDLSKVLERCFDRWEEAFDSVRQQDYTPAEFAQDLAEGWMDAAYFSMLPGARLAGLNLSLTTYLPTLRLIVLDKTVQMTDVVRVNRGGAGTQNDNLTHSAGNIPAANYVSSLATNGKRRYVFVTLDSPTIDGLGLGAGVYSGMVRDSGAGNAPLCRLIVVWPG